MRYPTSLCSINQKIFVRLFLFFADRCRARSNASQSEPAITRYGPGANDQSDHVAIFREHDNSMAAEILQRNRYQNLEIDQH